MSLRSTAFALLVALGPLCACALIVGIDERPLREAVVVDAGTDATVTPPEPEDPCAHATLPPPPAQSDGAEEGDYLVGVNVFRIETESAFGLDLDGTCTCHPGPNTAHGGAPSCESAEPTCDLDGGIDNALGSNAFATFGGAQPAQIRDSIACGRVNVMLRIFNYNGRANDVQVTVGFVPSLGIVTPHEEGEPVATCKEGKDFPPTYAPRWDGTDVISPESKYVLGNGMSTLLMGGYVTDGVLVATVKVSFPLIFGSMRLDLFQQQVMARITRLDAAGNEITGDEMATSLRLSGLFGGRVSVDSVLAAVEEITCPGEPLYEGIRMSICGAADVTLEAAEDHTGKRCNALSGAFGFEALPVRQGEPGTFDGGSPDCPGAVRRGCD